MGNFSLIETTFSGVFADLAMNHFSRRKAKLAIRQAKSNRDGNDMHTFGYWPIVCTRCVDGRIGDWKPVISTLVSIVHFILIHGSFCILFFGLGKQSAPKWAVEKTTRKKIQLARQRCKIFVVQMKLH
jgi:hypothetical protein